MNQIGIWNLNFFDLNFRVSLPVALFALVLFAALLFEDDDLVAATVLDDRGGDARALDRGRARLEAVVGGDDERFEFDRLAGLLVEQGDAHGLALRDAELFAARPDDCVSHFLYSSHTGGAVRPQKSRLL